MTSHAPIQLRISSNTLFLAGARELVYQVAHRLGFSEEACGQLALAVDEALCNIIRHGYDRDPDRPIWIFIQPEGGVPITGANVPPGTPPTEVDHSITTGLRIVLEDEAKQVDLASIKSRDLENVRPGGLGVHIINEVMDEVRYEHRTPRGMRLTMVKLRKPAEATAPEPHEPAGPAKS